MGNGYRALRELEVESSKVKAGMLGNLEAGKQVLDVLLVVNAPCVSSMF